MDQRPGRLGDGLVVLAAVRVGQVLRHIQNGLVRVVEGAAPAAGVGAVEAQLGAVMREVALHRQRRRGEYPGARMPFHLLPENVGDEQRRGVERQRLAEHLHPAHQARLPDIAPALEHELQLLRAAPAMLQPFRALRLRLQQLAEMRQLAGDLLQRLVEHRRQLRQRKARVLAGDGQAQVARRLLQRPRPLRQLGEVLRRRQALHARIARHVEQLRGRYILAEEQAGRLRQLVRLVEDHRVAGRQELRHAGIAQHHVGEEKMMVHHHHIGRLRLAPRRHDEALFCVGAFLAEAVVARRGRRQPGGGILRHGGALGLVAGRGGLGEAGDGEDVAGLLARQKAPFLAGALEVVVADVVGAALQQRHRRRRLQRVAHHRQIALE